MRKFISLPREFNPRKTKRTHTHMSWTLLLLLLRARDVTIYCLFGRGIVQRAFILLSLFREEGEEQEVEAREEEEDKENGEMFTACYT